MFHLASLLKISNGAKPVIAGRFSLRALSRNVMDCEFALLFGLIPLPRSQACFFSQCCRPHWNSLLALNHNILGRLRMNGSACKKIMILRRNLVIDRDAPTILRRPPRDHLGRMSYLAPSTTPHNIYEYPLFVLTLFWLRNLTHVVHLSRLYSIHCFLCLCGKFFQAKQHLNNAERELRISSVPNGHGIVDTGCLTSIHSKSGPSL